MLIVTAPSLRRSENTLVEECFAEFYRNTVLRPGHAPDHGELDIVATILPAAKKRGMKVFCSIEDVFRQMAESIPPLAGLSLSKIGDLGVRVVATPENSTTPFAPGEPGDEEIFERPLLHPPK